jgi:hypothetical protein
MFRAYVLCNLPTPNSQPFDKWPKGHPYLWFRAHVPFNLQTPNSKPPTLCLN